MSIIAIPFFALARFAEPGSGLDRPFIRSGLLRVAIPTGVVLGSLDEARAAGLVVVQAGPPCGFVSGAAKELPIDETFDGNNGMFPARQPIIGKPGTAQGQSAGGQIR